MNFINLDSYELSNIDIKQCLGPTKIIRYPNLKKYNDIVDCFDKQGRCIIFFETTSKNSGHWVCCFKQNPKTIIYFDPYGLAPDADLNYISKLAQVKLKETKPLLHALLRNAQMSGYDVQVSSYDYQQWKNNINTCGKHCVVRLMNQTLNLQQYYNFMKSYKSKYNLSSFDDVVSYIVYNIIGK